MSFHPIDSWLKAVEKSKNQPSIHKWSDLFNETDPRVKRRKSMKIIVVGGGWAGCSAALSAKKQGADVTLLERTDMLLGTGLVGGIMRNNGRFTATEEMIAMSGGEIFKVIESNLLHKIDRSLLHHVDLFSHKAATESIGRQFHLHILPNE